MEHFIIFILIFRSSLDRIGNMVGVATNAIMIDITIEIGVIRRIRATTATRGKSILNATMVIFQIT